MASFARADLDHPVATDDFFRLVKWAAAYEIRAPVEGGNKLSSASSTPAFCSVLLYSIIFATASALGADNYTWSGAGWHIGEPKRLRSNPLLGFPGYDKANMVTAGLTAEF